MKIWLQRRKISVAIAALALSAVVVQDCIVPQPAEARRRRTARKRTRKVAPQKIKWAASYAAAQKQAKATKRLIMVDVYTDWCGACHHLDDTTYKDRKVIQLSQRFVSVKINAEKGGEAFAKKYKIEGYPTILFLDASGKEVKRLLGAYPADEFSEVLVELTTPKKAKSKTA